MKENERTVRGMAEYIERESAIEAIMSDPPDAHYPNWYADKIKAIPAADVAPVRHGRWEKWNGDDRHHCTVCECYANAERDSYGYIAYEFLDNYCPNCGSKMDLEEPNEAKESRQP